MNTKFGESWLLGSEALKGNSKMFTGYTDDKTMMKHYIVSTFISSKLNDFSVSDTNENAVS